MEKKKRIIIFSHENDIDGLGSIILGKLAFNEIDYDLSSNVNVLETKFRTMLENGELNKYDNIYITDLALYSPSVELVKKDYELSRKVLVFDHHRSAINDGYNKYDFSNIVEVDEAGRKMCGTNLFYEYLISKGLITRTPALDEFVELTRLEDTWEWKNNQDKGTKAHDLAILFNVIGIEQYIDIMYKKLSTKETSFDLTSEEETIINNKKSEYLALLEQIWSNSELFKDESNNDYSAVYAGYEYRNELGEYVRSLSIKDLKYLVIIALEKGEFGQKSYRSIEDAFDVGKIAESHGGNGHPAAASVNITKEQREYALKLREISNRDSLEYLVKSSYRKK